MALYVGLREIVFIQVCWRYSHFDSLKCKKVIILSIVKVQDQYSYTKIIISLLMQFVFWVTSFPKQVPSYKKANDSGTTTQFLCWTCSTSNSNGHRDRTEQQQSFRWSACQRQRKRIATRRRLVHLDEITDPTTCSRVSHRYVSSWLYNS